jgi:hypothetical protein
LIDSDDNSVSIGEPPGDHFAQPPVTHATKDDEPTLLNMVDADGSSLSIAGPPADHFAQRPLAHSKKYD